MPLAVALQRWELLDVHNGELTAVLSVEEEARLVPAAVSDLGGGGGERNASFKLGTQMLLRHGFQMDTVKHTNGIEAFRNASLCVAKSPSWQTLLQNESRFFRLISEALDSLNMKTICC